jgi:hypothetical protein
VEGHPPPSHPFSNNFRVSCTLTIGVSPSRIKKFRGTGKLRRVAWGSTEKGNLRPASRLRYSSVQDCRPTLRGLGNISSCCNVGRFWVLGGIMRFAALLTITLIAVASIGLPPTEALAQSPLTDSQLMQLLVQLTVRKGYKDVELAPEACETLGLPLKPGVPRENSCSVYQAAYVDTDQITRHAFNVYGEPGTQAARIILLKLNTWGGPQYRTGLDGTLEAAGIGSTRGGTCCSWSAVPITVANVWNGLAEELAYWRAQRAALVKEPDRCSDRWNTEYPSHKCQQTENSPLVQ